MKIIIYIMCIIGLVLLLIWLSLEPPRECLKWERQITATYPNMGLLALGSAYTAFALMPVYVEQDVCVQYR